MVCHLVRKIDGTKGMHYYRSRMAVSNSNRKGRHGGTLVCHLVRKIDGTKVIDHEWLLASLIHSLTQPSVANQQKKDREPPALPSELP